MLPGDAGIKNQPPSYESLSKNTIGPAIRAHPVSAGILGLALVAGAAQADQALIAVASNFSGTAAELAADFHKTTGHTIVITAGSSGKLYAQLSNGAPFAAFLSADVERAQKLEQDGLVVPGSRFTYAVGRLALWSASPRNAGKSCGAELRLGHFDKLALANPLTAPYGAAAIEVLKAMGIDPDKLAGRLVQGENIAQTLQFVESGSADLGFVALSQVLPGSNAARVGTCLWEIPMQQHQPIEQQAVLMKKFAGNAAASGFLAYLASPRALKTIEAHGYALPR